MVIQRLQNLYLLLAAIIMAVFVFVPVMNVTSEAGLFTLSALSTGISGNPMQPHWLLLCLDVLIVVMLVATLFKFKDLRLQMKLCKVNLTLIVALILSIFVMWCLQRGHGIAVMTLWMMLPFAAMVLTMMANGCIKNDQKLLSDSERLR